MTGALWFTWLLWISLGSANPISSFSVRLADPARSLVFEISASDQTQSFYLVQFDSLTNPSQSSIVWQGSNSIGHPLSFTLPNETNSQPPTGSQFFQIYSHPHIPPPVLSIPGFVWLPPGARNIGSPNSEHGRDLDEGPVTQVVFSQGFWIAQTEVTQAEYFAIMTNSPSQYTGGPSDQVSRLPVERVTWFEAVEYCRLLTSRVAEAGQLPIGYSYRLPTGAEWEFACRGGWDRPYGVDNGHVMLTNLANFDWQYQHDARTGYLLDDLVRIIGHPSPVASFSPNAFGLFDMHGNVWEWVDDNIRGVHPGGVLFDYVGPEGSRKFLKGGGFDSIGWHCRCANRSTFLPANERAANAGFRVVLAPNRSTLPAP